MDIIVILLLIIVIFLLLQNQGIIGLIFLKGGRRKIIVDSCALIDGRIVELVRTGFVADQLIIPRFVLSELQLLADGNDTQKRERARFGLEVAAELQEYTWVDVLIDETKIPQVNTTDDKLIRLAKKRRAVLCTTDYSLNKVASVERIKVLNIHDLVQSLRPVALPGEKVKVKITQKGNNLQQGVGYLEDGTMIVVEGAARAVGSTITAEVDRMHQTIAGKMVFAHVLPKSTTPKTSIQNAKSVRKTATAVASRLRQATAGKQATRRKKLVL